MEPALEDQVVRVVERGGLRVGFVPSPRWVRVRFGDVFVADSKRVMLLFVHQRLPVYYFPRDDVLTDRLVPSPRRKPAEQGERSYWHVESGGRRADDAAWSFEDPAEEYAFLKGYLAFHWHKMDAWFEEEDEVFVHPRDPYHRVDVLQSARHVRVVLGGETVAESQRPRLLFETGLPTRYYLPKLDVRMDLLVPTETRTSCPYKGQAVYWSARIGDGVFVDVVWSYPSPIPECPKIENFLCFFNERVDAIYVDGELQSVPETPWSRPRDAAGRRA